MPAGRFRKKPVVVDAVQWTGDNEGELDAFCSTEFDVLGAPVDDDPEATAQVFDRLHSTWILVYAGDWIIRGLRGEFYPCRDSVFRESYEPA